MDRFNISDIENLCNIKAHTLRIWEKRYGLIMPKRKESNHRYYDNEDLKHILRLSFLYHTGFKISKIASLDKNDLKKIALKNVSDTGSQQLLINQLLEAAIDFDENRCDDILSNAIDRMGLEQCMINVVYPYFEKVGLLWMNEGAIPAQEHVSSNIIRNKLILAIDKLQTTRSHLKKTVALFTPEEEHHEIPLLFAHYLFKKNNIRVIYLGAGITLKELKEFCALKKTNTLYFHLITNFTKQNINDYIASLCKICKEYHIIMSGPVTNQVATPPKHFTLLTSLDQMINYIKDN
jgi:DNA-binding transcriptional MerR regulator